MAILSEPTVEMMAPTPADDVSERAVDLTVEHMVHEHSRFVFRLAYSILRNRDEAEDAAQEVFIRVLKNANKLSEVRDARLWLARVAWRVTLDWKKSLDKRRPAEKSEAILDELSARGSSSEQLVADKQMTAILEKMIATLPADLRETLALSTVQELNATEIGAVLGIPEASVRTRLLRARTLLKQKMAAVMGERNG